MKDLLAQCDREIAAAESLLRAGHPDIEGILRWYADWHQERKLIEATLIRDTPRSTQPAQP